MVHCVSMHSRHSHYDLSARRKIGDKKSLDITICKLLNKQQYNQNKGVWCFCDVKSVEREPWTYLSVFRQSEARETTRALSHSRRGTEALPAVFFAPINSIISDEYRKLVPFIPCSDCNRSVTTYILSALLRRRGNMH